MIRIDEIYQNVFLPLVAKKPYHSIHWFDPFGSVKFRDLCSAPPISSALPSDPTKPNHAVVRYLFWDQEPLHDETTNQTLTEFTRIFNTGKKHIVVSEFSSQYVKNIQERHGFTPHYYFFHAWAALDWFRGYDRTHLSIPFQNRNIEKTFLCPNNIVGGKRVHRLKLFSELVRNNLINDNFISFPNHCPHENKSVADLCLENNISLGKIDLPLIIDKKRNFHNHSHCIDLWNEANRSLLQVVTETVYTGQRQHLTEKTFKPIVMQQPFILVSCRGSLEYLKRYGFQTFGNFWEEEYDELDDDCRISAIAKLLVDINSLSKKEKQQLQRKIAPIVEYNHKWFYSREFEQLLWKEMCGILENFK